MMIASNGEQIPFRSELESLPEKQDEWTVRISLPEDWW
jgi:hypothetical protein